MNLQYQARLTILTKRQNQKHLKICLLRVLLSMLNPFDFNLTLFYHCFIVASNVEVHLDYRAVLFSPFNKLRYILQRPLTSLDYNFLHTILYQS